MALLNVSLPTAPSTIPRFLLSNNENRIRGVKVKVPSLRKGSHLSVKCLKEETKLLPQFDLGEVNPLYGLVVKREDFPLDFKFGASTSAIQTEGAGDEGGRGRSTWDSFLQDGSGVKHIATDSYNRYKDDVRLLKRMGADAYRFSISWSRILPRGTKKGGVNEEGIKFYNNFIDELLLNGIEPYVTLLHFDVPQALEDDYEGFMSEKIVDDFKDYAEICYKNFGDRVKHWITVNEPQIFSQYGILFGTPKPNFDPVKHPFIIVHNMLLAHAAAAKLYKNEFQASQGGKVGLALVSEWYEPYTNSPLDKEATGRAYDFYMGWILDPIVFGDYPLIMKGLAKDVLPTFTDKQKELLQGSYDFIGLNHYTSRYAKFRTIIPDDEITSFKDYKCVELKVERPDGEPIGEKAPGSGYIYIYPQGLTNALIHVKKKYNNPTIFITENGYAEIRDDSLPLKRALKDDVRVEWIYKHLHAIREARKEGVEVRGYFVWSMLDCMEMGSGYRVRFGMNFVDYNDNLKRYQKKSAKWLKSFNNQP